MGNAWQSFFDLHAPKYDGHEFTHATDAEIAFLRHALHLDQPLAPDAVVRPRRVLDIGCGTGRHAVALARLGHHVTGVDQSEGMLRIARDRACAAGPEAEERLELVLTDARAFVRPQSFDVAICLCEGALCLHDAREAADDPDADLRLLQSIAESLVEGGRLVVNALNGCRMIRHFSENDVEAGRFDILTCSERSEVAGIEPDLHSEEAEHLRERGYTPAEFARMLTWSGFRVEGVYGGTAGDWGRRPPRLDEMELMAIAERRTG